MKKEGLTLVLLFLVLSVLFINCCVEDPDKALIYIPDSTNVSLSSENVDKFIEWACTSDSDGFLRVRDSIVAFRERFADDTTVIRKLISKYYQIDENDLGSRLIVLGIIGELKNPLAFDLLYNKMIFEKFPGEEDSPKSVPDLMLTEKDRFEILQSKMLECAAYLKEPRSKKLVEDVIKKHTSLAVRSTAVDAYIYNHDDPVRAEEDLLRILKDPKSELQKSDFDQLITLVDRVRFIRSVSKKTFNQNLEQFYKRHPEQLPAIPDTSNIKPGPKP